MVYSVLTACNLIPEAPNIDKYSAAGLDMSRSTVQIDECDEVRVSLGNDLDVRYSIVGGLA